MKLWSDGEWLKLLHYRKFFFGVFAKGESPDGSFYVSPEGRRSPKKELLESLEMIFGNHGRPGAGFRCAFPQRYAFLKEKLFPLLEDIPEPACPDLEEWKNRLRPMGVALLFAGGYLNNPSTLYGHTFLRLKKSGEPDDLLDYTLNYAAETDDKSGIFFAVKGLAGMYPGRFSTIPYYLKIQEYHNLENRDIWEFPLDLTREEKERLLNHAWELGKASFPYYFFTKNCSYQLLPLLDIARPGLNLTEKFGTWVLPSDTVKYILGKYPGASAFSWRPSLSKTLRWEYSALPENIRAAALAFARNPLGEKDFADALPLKEKAAVLEFAADYQKYLFYSGKTAKREWDGNSNIILAKRAALGRVETFTGLPPRPPSLLESHDSMRVSAGMIFRKKRFFQTFSWRAAIQDLLDDDKGYLPRSELEIGGLKVEYDSGRRRLLPKEILIANVLSLNPLDPIEKRKSWRMSLSLKTPDSGTRGRDGLMADASFASGIALPAGGENVFYFLPELNLGYGGVLDYNYRAGLGAEAGLLLAAGRTRVLAGSKYISCFSGEKGILFSYGASAAFNFAQNSSFRVSASFGRRPAEFRAEFLRYMFPP